MAAKPIPEGYHSLTPYLAVEDAARAIDFYREAFDAQELLRMPWPDGKIAHAELQLGDSKLMLSDPFEQSQVQPPSARGGPTASVFMYVEDVDATFEPAQRADGEEHRQERQHGIERRRRRHAASLLSCSSPTDGLEVVRRADAPISPTTRFPMASETKGSSAVEALLKEKRKFPPPKEFVKRANVNRASVYAEAAKNPVRFWERFARELDWFKPWKKTLEWKPPYAKWFIGGQLNISRNCLEVKYRLAR